MKFLPIVWRNLLRRKFRTAFTMGAIFFAFLLFGVLMAIRSAFCWSTNRTRCCAALSRLRAIRMRRLRSSP